MRRTPLPATATGLARARRSCSTRSGNDIIGPIGRASTTSPSSINPATGVVTFADNTANNLWHANTGNPDDPQTLTLANANLLQLVQTVTDADGDSDTAAINLGVGVFTDPGRRSGCGCGQCDGCGDCAGREPGCSGVATALCLRPGTSRSTLRRRRLRHRRCWQRDLFAGSDRLERGVRAVCAGCGGHHCRRRRRDWPGRPIVLNQVRQRHHRLDRRDHLLHHPDQPGDGRGDVHRQHGEQSVAREHGQP